jgi:calcineurin-like phosphoesterase family protein
MAIWFTSDWHFGDPRVKILGRPFADDREMTERIIAEFNALVSDEDTVYVIGDVLSTVSNETLEVLKRLKGTLVLIKGNHDLKDDEEYAPYFDQIIQEGDGLELEVAGIPCYLTHYPTTGRPDRFNLVGHIHGVWRVQKNMLNVGVDANHFRPISEEDVKFFLTAIEEFYDGDVWCGQHENNIACDERGRTTSYYDDKAAKEAAAAEAELAEPAQ